MTQQPIEAYPSSVESSCGVRSGSCGNMVGLGDAWGDHVRLMSRAPIREMQRKRYKLWWCMVLETRYCHQMCASAQLCRPKGSPLLRL